MFKEFYFINHDNEHIDVFSECDNDRVYFIDTNGNVLEEFNTNMEYFLDSVYIQAKKIVVPDNEYKEIIEKEFKSYE